MGGTEVISCGMREDSISRVPKSVSGPQPDRVTYSNFMKTGSLFNLFDRFHWFHLRHGALVFLRQYHLSMYCVGRRG